MNIIMFNLYINVYLSFYNNMNLDHRHRNWSLKPSHKTLAHHLATLLLSLLDKTVKQITNDQTVYK